MKALRYLDKIIHLPFFIPPISAKKRLNLVETLLNGTDNSCQKTLQRLKNYVKVLTSLPSLHLMKVAPEPLFAAFASDGTQL